MSLTYCFISRSKLQGDLKAAERAENQDGDAAGKTKLESVWSTSQRVHRHGRRNTHVRPLQTPAQLLCIRYEG